MSAYMCTYHPWLISLNAWSLLDCFCFVVQTYTDGFFPDWLSVNLVQQWRWTVNHIVDVCLGIKFEDVCSDCLRWKRVDWLDTTATSALVTSNALWLIGAVVCVSWQHVTSPQRNSRTEHFVNSYAVVSRDHIDYAILPYRLRVRWPCNNRSAERSDDIVHKRTSHACQPAPTKFTATVTRTHT